MQEPLKRHFGNSGFVPLRDGLVHKMWAVVLTLLLSAGASFGQAEVASSPSLEVTSSGKTVVLEVGPYAFVTADQGRYLTEAIDNAAKASARAIILRIDCRGGLAAEVRRFAEKLDACEIETIALVLADVAGAGAIAALAADRIYLHPQAKFGGEVEAIDWRGPQDALPARLTDLSYPDITDDLVGLFESRGRDAQLVKGICDPEVQVTIDGKKYSDQGDVLTISAEQGEALGLIAGTAATVEDVITAEQLGGIKNVSAPKVVIRAAPEKGGGKDVSEVASKAEAEGDGGTSKASDLVANKTEDGAADQSSDEENAGDRSFGETRMQDYSGKVVVIPVEMDSLIRKTKFDFMKRVIAKANADGAEAIIFDMNTPGGIAWYTEEIMLADLPGLDVPTYTFVNPKAMSAGALIAIATDHIYMHSPSTIGAAAPVTGQGADIAETMLQKVMSDILSTADDVARNKGHDPAIAKAFVDPKAELEILLPVISTEGSLESRQAFDPITSEELLVLNSADATQIINGQPVFAEGTADSVDDLVKQLGLSGKQITAKPLGAEAFADFLVKIAPWLLLFGLAGAYMELKAPGFGLPGVIGLICLGLFFFGHHVAGYFAGFEAIGIFVLGIVLLLVEIFVFPGLLVFGLAGMVMIFGSLIYSMVPADIDWGGPLNFGGFTGLIVGPAFNLVLGALGACILVVLSLRYLPSTPLMRWMVLDRSLDKGSGIQFAGEAAALEEGAVGGSGGLRDGQDHSLVGRSGKAATDLRPTGAAFFDDDRLDVITTGDFIEAGTAVRIIEHEGSRIVVDAI